MADCLPRAIAFFHSQLVSRAFTPGGDDPSEKFLVRCLLALRNTLSTSAYLPTARAAPQAHTCHQALAAFFSSSALAQLCRALLTRALVLSPAELAEYAPMWKAVAQALRPLRPSGTHTRQRQIG